MKKVLLSICREYWLPLVSVLVVGISQTFIGNSTILYFQRLLDGLPTAKTFNDVLPALSAYAGLWAANHFLIYLEGYPDSILNNGAFQWAKLRALKKIARIDTLAYQDLGTGNLVQLIENGAASTRNILTGFYLKIAREILPGVLISLFFIRGYDQTLFLFVLLSYGVLYLISNVLMAALRREMEKMLVNQEDFSRFSVRAFMELVVFRINGRFKAEYERVKGISDEIVRARARIYLVQELFYTGFAFLVFLIEVGVVVQQVNKILAGTSTVGTLVALVSLIHLVFAPISTFSFAVATYKLERVAFDRFQQFLLLPEDAGLGKGSRLTVQKGAVEFRDVGFSYPGRLNSDQDGDGECSRELLAHFSLTIEGGSMVALVGPSGGGKTTLVRLLLALLKPQSGQVLIDGQDLARVDLETFYQQVAYIPQDAPIFDGSLRENITFGERVDDPHLREVIAQVGLDEWLSHLSAGLETIVGERGVKLSGGERQRLAFGRVLVQNPKIVILDEPTSALDSITEQVITENMREFMHGKTMLVIAHRLQTVKDAQRILVLEDGKIVQEGSFDALLCVDGRFRQLWEEQTREN